LLLCAHIAETAAHHQSAAFQGLPLASGYRP
jgi:hypothetical protein